MLLDILTLSGSWGVGACSAGWDASLFAWMRYHHARKAASATIKNKPTCSEKWTVPRMLVG